MSRSGPRRRHGRTRGRSNRISSSVARCATSSRSRTERLAFRGGTALNKLLFNQPLRYSEDIDLVQIRPEPIGKTVDAVRGALSWLGPCRRKSAAHSVHLVFSFSPEAAPASNAKLKVEINTREHEHL
jgi:hypothetical protein